MAGEGYDVELPGNRADPHPSAFDTRTDVVIVKLGGSLLDLPDLGARLESLLAQRPGIRPLLIVGGGAAADAVRKWDRTYALGEVISHELAIEAMRLTALLMHKLLPRSRIVATFAEATESWDGGELPIHSFPPAELCDATSERLTSDNSEHDALDTDLPMSWAVTSDSLAASLAIRHRADELWLLKSVDLSPGVSVAEASRRNLVDEYFPQLAPRIGRILWCNLRRRDRRLEPIGA